MRAVQFADEEVDVATELGAGAGSGDVGLPFNAQRVPVVMIEVGEEEAMIERAPGLLEDDLLLVIEVDFDGCGDRDGPGCARVERDGVNARRGFAASVCAAAHAAGPSR